MTNSTTTSQRVSSSYVKGEGNTTHPDHNLFVESYLDRGTESGEVKGYIRSKIFVKGPDGSSKGIKLMFWGEAAQKVKEELIDNKRVLTIKMHNARLDVDEYNGKRYHSLHLNYEKQFEVLESRAHSSERRPDVFDMIPDEAEASREAATANLGSGYEAVLMAQADSMYPPIA